MENATEKKELEKTESGEYKEKQMLPTKGIEGFVPKTMPELEHMSKVLAGSDAVPKELRGKPANVMLCIMHGLELGVSPAQALSGIMVVNGRPSVWGDLALGIIRRSGLLADFKEDNATTALANKSGKCYAKRTNGEEISFSFNEQMMVSARLDKKQGPWQEYRGRMYQMRSRAWVLRDLFGDVLKGLCIVEEQRDAPMKDVSPGAGGVPMPKRASEAIKAEAVEGSAEPAQEQLESKPETKPEPTPEPKTVGPGNEKETKPEPKKEEPAKAEAKVMVARFFIKAINKTSKRGKDEHAIRPIVESMEGDVSDGQGVAFYTNKEVAVGIASQAKKDNNMIQVAWEGEGKDLDITGLKVV